MRILFLATLFFTFHLVEAATLTYSEILPPASHALQANPHQCIQDWATQHPTDEYWGGNGFWQVTENGADVIVIGNLNVRARNQDCLEGYGASIDGEIENPGPYGLEISVNAEPGESPGDYVIVEVIVDIDGSLTAGGFSANSAENGLAEWDMWMKFDTVQVYSQTETQTHESGSFFDVETTRIIQERELLDHPHARTYHYVFVTTVGSVHRITANHNGSCTIPAVQSAGSCKMQLTEEIRFHPR